MLPRVELSIFKKLDGFLHFLDGLKKSEEEEEEEIFYVFINLVFCNYVFCKVFIVFYIFSHHTQWASDTTKNLINKGAQFLHCIMASAINITRIGHTSALPCMGLYFGNACLFQAIKPCSIMQALPLPRGSWRNDDVFWINVLPAYN